MQIPVKDISSAYTMNEDGMFRCAHDNAVVEKSCCLGADCACQGIDLIYCPECDNSELTAREMVQITESLQC